MRPLDRLLVGLGLGLAALRILYAVESLSAAPVLRQPLADSLFYVHEARRIAGGELVPDSPFYRAPLYPYVLAPFYALRPTPEATIVVLQLAAGLAILALAAWTARRLYGAAAACVTLVLLGLYGPLASQETKLLPTTIGILLATASLAILLRAGRPRAFAGAGILLGAGALARPPLLAAALGAAACLAWRAPRGPAVRTRVAPLLAGVALGIAPATAMNLLAGEAVLICTNGGMTFFHGNHLENRHGLLERSPRAGFAGNAIEQARRDRERASELAGRALTAAQASAFWWRAGFSDLAADPARALRLAAQKLRRALGVHEYADNYSFAVERALLPRLRALPAVFPLLWIPALCALFLRPVRGREEGIAAVFAALGIATCVVFYVGSRYRCESAPALSILAGSAAAGWRSAPRRRRIVAAIAATAAIAVAAVPAGLAARAQDSMAAAQWGGALEREGRTQEARAAYEVATRLEASNAVAWGRRSALAERGDGVRAALSILDEAIARGADGPLLRAERGTARLRAGDADGAEEDLRRALEGFPRDPLLTRDLAVSLLAQGADAEADSLLRHPGLAQDPTALAARSILAARSGERQTAALLAAEARRLGPVLLPEALRLPPAPASPMGPAPR